MRVDCGMLEKYFKVVGERCECWGGCLVFGTCT